MPNRSAGCTHAVAKFGPRRLTTKLLHREPAKVVGKNTSDNDREHGTWKQPSLRDMCGTTETHFDEFSPICLSGNTQATHRFTDPRVSLKSRRVRSHLRQTSAPKLRQPQPCLRQLPRSDAPDAPNVPDANHLALLCRRRPRAQPPNTCPRNRKHPAYDFGIVFVPGEFLQEFASFGGENLSKF